jgi:predicted nucleic acid-binding Zn ribbon protein
MSKLQCVGNYIIAKQKGKCCVCGKPTRIVEMNYEDFVCSPECEVVLDKEYQDRLAKMPEIDL